TGFEQADTVNRPWLVRDASTERRLQVFDMALIKQPEKDRLAAASGPQLGDRDCVRFCFHTPFLGVRAGGEKFRVSLDQLGALPGRWTARMGRDGERSHQRQTPV